MMAFFACDTMPFFFQNGLSHALKLMINTFNVFDSLMKAQTKSPGQIWRDR